MKFHTFVITSVLFITSVFLYSSECTAHTRSKGKSSFQLSPEGFIKIQIGMTTLDFLDLADVDLGSPNATQQDELKAERFLLKYFPKYLRIHLLPGQEQCHVKFKSLQRTDHKNIELFAFAQCPEKSMAVTKELRIDWGLFTGTILMHRSFASFFWSDVLKHNWVFSRKESKKVLTIKTPSFLDTGASFFKEGFWHFMTGYDHICFLLLIFLICAQIKPLVLLVSGFTIAHGSSLLLSYFDILRVPSSAVEFGIALSIILSALHVLQHKEKASDDTLVDKSTFFIILFFGLIHGLGFATLLRELLQESPFLWTGIFSFHLGLELAQLLSLACFWIFALKPKSGLRWGFIKKCLAGGCGLSGLYWVLERMP
jgi:hypothetical protein